METLSSKEYAHMISETENEKELRESYEANLIAMGKDSANQIQDAFNQGKIMALKHIMDTYTAVKNHYNNLEGLTFDVIDLMLAEAITEIMEENEI